MTAFINACAAHPDFAKYEPPARDEDDDDRRCVILHSSVTVMMAIDVGTLPDRQRLNINTQLSAFVRGDKFTILPAPLNGQPPLEVWSDVRGLIGYRGILWELKFRKPLQYRMIGVVPSLDYFVGLKLVPRNGIDWKVECNNVLSLYDSVRGNEQCTAVQSDNCTAAFTHWRIPS